MEWLPIYGYIGSALVAVSLMMNSLVRLRWINLFGASVFSSYGFLIGAYPVFILNSLIVLVDIYYIVRMSRKKDFFVLLPVDSAHSPFLGLFLNFYGNDIKKYFPAFDAVIDNRQDTCIFILRNLMPVGLFVYRREKDVASIRLDYVIPKYRDLANAHFLYQEWRDKIGSHGIRELRAVTNVDRHFKYLRKMGFREKSATVEGGIEFYLKVNNG